MSTVDTTQDIVSIYHAPPQDLVPTRPLPPPARFLAVRSIDGDSSGLRDHKGRVEIFLSRIYTSVSSLDSNIIYRTSIIKGLFFKGLIIEHRPAEPSLPFQVEKITLYRIMIVCYYRDITNFGGDGHV